MTQLKSAEDLQTHFEEKHSEPNPDDSQPLTPSTRTLVLLGRNIIQVNC